MDDKTKIVRVDKDNRVIAIIEEASVDVDALGDDYVETDTEVGLGWVMQDNGTFKAPDDDDEGETA